MSLSFRQQQTFLWTISIYRLKARPIGGSSGIYDSTPIATGVKAQYISSTEAAEPGQVGRSNRDIVISLDGFAMLHDVDVRDTDAIVITAGPTGFPDVNKQWVCVGNAQPMSWRAQELHIYARQSPPLAGVPV